MYENTLPGTTAEALERVGASGLLDQAYLAGGTAAALQMGHRISRDLDFFTDQPFDEEKVLEQLSPLGLTHRVKEWRTIMGTLDGVSFSYFYYKYPLLFETIPYRNIRIADLRDLAAMKTDAIATRGIKRDFIDLYRIMEMKNLSLAIILGFYQRKYEAGSNMLAHALNSLTYFDDAETQEKEDRPLELLQPLDWEKVKRFFREEVERTSRELLLH